MKAQHKDVHKCPVCRSPISIHASALPVNVLVQGIINKLYPTEYDQRLIEANDDAKEIQVQLPLLCSGFRALFPHQTVHMILAQECSLVMIKRCLLGNRCFGYLTKPDPTEGLIGTVAEIQHCRKKQDGRMHLIVKGLRRFRVSKHWVAEPQRIGLKYAAIEEIKDTEVWEPSSDEGDSNWPHRELFKVYLRQNEGVPIEELAKRARCLLQSMIEMLKDDKKRTFCRVFGPMPMRSMSQFSYWISNVVGMTDDLRECMLAAPSVRQRICLSLFQLEEIYIAEKAKEPSHSTTEENKANHHLANGAELLRNESGNSTPVHVASQH